MKKEYLLFLVLGLALISGCAKTPSSSYCDTILPPDEKNSCYETVAVTKSTPDTCLKSTTELQQNVCLRNYALAKNDINLCDKVPDTGQTELCIRNIAIKTNNSKLCSQILDGTVKEDCINGSK